MLGHYLKDNFLKPLPKIQDSILIFPSNSNFIAVDSQFSRGIPLGAEEGLELRVLTPPWHTQGFGTAGGRSQIKNLPSGMILWGIRRNMRRGMKSQNCFFFTHWILTDIFPVSRAPWTSGFCWNHHSLCSRTTFIPLRPNPSDATELWVMKSGFYSAPLGRTPAHSCFSGCWFQWLHSHPDQFSLY